MQLDKYTQCSYFEIWEPLYREKVVLLAKRKVGTHNKIVFTGNPKTGYNMMGDQPYYMSGAAIKKCKESSNGTIPCYEVPIDKLQLLTINERDIRSLV